MSQKVTEQQLVATLSSGSDFNIAGFGMDFNVCPIKLDFYGNESGDSKTIKELIVTGAVCKYKGSYVHRETTPVADDAEIALATGVSGVGEVIIGDNQEWAHFRFTSSGIITLIQNTGNVSNTDLDANLCIYDAGSGIAIKNRLGSQLNVTINVTYA